MRKILLFIIIIPAVCFGINLDGFWLEKTPVVASAYLAGYHFHADSFWYSVNEYDGLNPIRAFGGTYILEKDSIELNVLYIKRKSNLVIYRDPYSTVNREWAVDESGTLIVDTLAAPQLFVLSIEKDSQKLTIEGTPYYRSEY